MLGKNKFVYAAAGAAVGISAPLLIYVFLILFGLPGADKLKPILVMLCAVYTLLGAIGTYLGLWLYDKKLKDKAFVKQIQG